MLLLVTALLLVSPALGVLEPEEMQFTRYQEIRRTASYDMPCPPRAVCAVAYDFRRLVNGERRPERRVIFNCMCEGNTDCPIDPEHRLYVSSKTRNYLCQPRSTLVNCNNSERESMGLNARPAETLIYQSHEFAYIPFTRVNCVCPRHLRPAQPRQRFDMALATEHSRFHFMAGISYEYRICSRN